MIDERQVPKKIRQLRLDRNLTQQELADAAGVTKGYISRIENADSAPPVGTLISLAEALKVRFQDFFEADNRESIVTMTRREERPSVGRDSKAPFKYEHLAFGFPNRAFESYLAKFPGRSEMSIPSQHNGQELVFMVNGVLEFNVEDQNFILEPGDSLYFNSSYRHNARCISEEDAEVICIIWNGDHTEK